MSYMYVQKYTLKMTHKTLHL